MDYLTPGEIAALKRRLPLMLLEEFSEPSAPRCEACFLILPAHVADCVNTPYEDLGDDSTTYGGERA